MQELKKIENNNQQKNILQKTVISFFIFLNVSPYLKADRYAPAPTVKNIFYDLPILETERLLLRKVTAHDVVELHEIYADPEVINYVACELDVSLEQTQKWVNWRLEKYKDGKPTHGQWC